MVDRHIHCCPWSHIYTHRKNRRIVIWLQSVPIVEAYTCAQIMETTDSDRKKEQQKEQNTEPDGEGEYFWGQVYGISREKKCTHNTECSPLTDTATDMYKPQTDVSFVLFTQIYTRRETVICNTQPV